MSILHLAGGLNLDAGGPARSVPNSVLACLEAGLDVTLAIPDRDPVALRRRADVREIADRGGRVEVFALSAPRSSVTRRYGVSLPLMRYVARRAGEFDVVHLRGAWLAGSLLAAALRRRPGRDPGSSGAAGRGPAPVVVLSPHETLTRFDLAQSRSPATRTLKRLGRGLLDSGVDAIVYSSELELADSDHDREPPRAFVVHHPVPHLAPPAGTSVAPAAGGPLRVGFLGRFHPKKNLGTLIEAVGQLPGDAVTLEVAGMGDPVEAERLRRLAEAAGVAARVRWRGFVDGEAKTALLRGIDLLAMPSSYECFGMAAAEALACGVPVLVGDRVGVAPVVRRYGCGVVAAPEVEAITEALAFLVRQPDRLAIMAARAEEAACEEFSFAAHGAALRRVYEGLAEERRQRLLETLGG